jgi:hypothetical protein
MKKMVMILGALLVLSSCAAIQSQWDHYMHEDEDMNNVTKKTTDDFW